MNNHLFVLYCVRIRRLELFQCIRNFLKRLHIYTGISLDTLTKDIATEIMVELISILALVKKRIGRDAVSLLSEGDNL